MIPPVAFPVLTLGVVQVDGLVGATKTAPARDATQSATDIVVTETVSGNVTVMLSESRKTPR